MTEIKSELDKYKIELDGYKVSIKSTSGYVFDDSTQQYAVMVFGFTEEPKTDNDCKRIKDEFERFIETFKIALEKVLNKRQKEIEEFAPTI